MIGLLNRNYILNDLFEMIIIFHKIGYQKIKFVEQGFSIYKYLISGSLIIL